MRRNYIKDMLSRRGNRDLDDIYNRLRKVKKKDEFHENEFYKIKFRRPWLLKNLKLKKLKT